MVPGALIGDGITHGGALAGTDHSLALGLDPGAGEADLAGELASDGDSEADSDLESGAHLTSTVEASEDTTTA